MNYTLFIQAFLSKYRGIADKNLLFHYLREELQYLILGIIYTKTKYPIYFMGGTALRLSYGINRFSEDLDFALEAPNSKFPSNRFFSDIVSAFDKKTTGFNFNANLNAKRNVVKIMLSFGQILYDIGFTPIKNQSIKIKIELDINPPGNAVHETKTYRSLFNDYLVNAYDLPTGFSGKLSAVLYREYQKGRDYYDLQWYLERRPQVAINFAYLNANSIQQGKNAFSNIQDVFRATIEKVKLTDISLLKQDLERFIHMDKASFDIWLESYIPSTIQLLQLYINTHEIR